MKETVAILAPSGRNQAVIEQILATASIKCCSVTAQELIAGLDEGQFSVAVLTQEVLPMLPINRLQQVLAAQESWSDFPFVVLISKGETSSETFRLINALGNVSQVERPMHPATLCRAVSSATRARKRQREAQSYVSARAEAEQQLRDLAINLEHRVSERTQALSEANLRLQLEMSARLAAQTRMDEFQAELIHISRVSAMGTMASTLAHELNQPLAAVMNYVAAVRLLLVGAATPTPANILAALDAARANAHESAEIVRRLRDLVARGEVNRKHEQLPMLIQDALKLGMIDASSKGVRCEVALDPAASDVLVDRVQIQQVLINLVRNAIDAMQDTPNKLISIGSRRIAGQMIEVTVADTGPGIPPSKIPTLFSPFQTTKPDGLGIGLSISRTIIEANGGTITGSNGADGGAVFRFTIPRNP